VPEVGESVIEALVAKWHKKEGDNVEKDDPICEIETDKITMELNAEVDGVLSVRVPEGTTVRIGAVIGEIDEQVTAKVATVSPAAVPPATSLSHISPSERKAARGKSGDMGPGTGQAVKPQVKEEVKVKEKQESLFQQGVHSEEPEVYQTSSAASRAAEDKRITRQPMTPIRRRIAERLLAARQQTAMLTTFNEADMGRVMELRKKHGVDFTRRHGVKLGFMPFFVKACVEALGEFPAVNARIDGNDIIYQHFYDLGIAVSGEKGLVVPVLRSADRLHFYEIEKSIEDFVELIRSNKLAISDLEGGTFTISNGGIFGSLLSTPILNPPQSGVLGMHTVQERPVARKGKVVIRPMMYLALSYDHRIIDGREAVHFLRKVIEYIEEPEEMLLEG
ncbi:MAG TPA: 2-oxoglutarate dehydrogenase complex dihydrolipoyllysine-residue succinyltransferase, partial [Geobacteraceae bacterium]|nr:2-oxoglutarate dehydrogenase complex dihydrolipoyllysine-residue succinyltransferase [Geobacteraceae bacterium]